MKKILKSNLNRIFFQYIGVRRDPIRNNSFHQMEIYFGEFRIEVSINQPIKPDSVAAEYHNGFLEIMLEKAEPHEIPINEQGFLIKNGCLPLECKFKRNIELV